MKIEKRYKFCLRRLLISYWLIIGPKTEWKLVRLTCRDNLLQHET